MNRLETEGIVVKCSSRTDFEINRRYDAGEQNSSILVDKTTMCVYSEIDSIHLSVITMRVLSQNLCGNYILQHYLPFLTYSLLRFRQ